MILTIYKAYLFCGLLVAFPLCIASYFVIHSEETADIDLLQEY